MLRQYDGSQASAPAFQDWLACQGALRSPGERALRELLAGNARFSKGQRKRTLRASDDVLLRRRLAETIQAPIAAILGCCDSRAALNLIFDQELGRIFSVQVAANVLNPHAIASLEFAVEQFRVPLVMVLGHTQCGALQAAYEAEGRKLPGFLPVLQSQLAAFLAQTLPKRQEAQPAYLERLARENARSQVTSLLAQSEVLHRRWLEGRLTVVGALYQLKTGKVSVIQ